MLNIQAKKLNDLLALECDWIDIMFSLTWKNIFFPSEWIVKQTQEAKWTKYNATIWIALDENNETLILEEFLNNLQNNNKSLFTYAPTTWISDLRLLWKNEIYRKNPWIKNQISLPIVTNWLTHAINTIASLFLQKEDNIIIPDLFWWNYRLLFETVNNANIVTYNTFKNNWLDLNSLDEIISLQESEKIVLLFNFPNNPSWYSPDKNEVIKIREIIEKYTNLWKKILVIIDDAYFGLFYEESTYKESLFSELSKIEKNVLLVKIDWVSKEDYAWWLRVWFITFSWNFSHNFYSLLEQKVAWLLRATISNISNITQNIVLNSYKNPLLDTQKKSNFLILKSRYEEIKDILNSWVYNDFFEALPFNSWYFMAIRLKKSNAEEIRKKLLESYSTWVISVWKDILRIAFSSTKKSDIKSLFENIKNAILELNN